MSRIFENPRHWQDFRGGLGPDVRVGFVPTMGALHDGHLSLVKRSQAENDHTVVSVFLNPTQFDKPEDLKSYPSSLTEDLKLLGDLGEISVFLPKPADMYGDGYRFRVNESQLSQVLCGAHRPGHFDGVLTVVLKLLNLIGPRRAYFGEKDYQQLLLVREMVGAFFLPVEIVNCPIVREPSGLAMSSRNRRLSAADREQRAPLLYREIRSRVPAEEVRRRLTDQGFEVDYVEDRFERRFAAVSLPGSGGPVRLIDNVPLGGASP